MSLGISAGDLAAMRADIAELLPETCVISAPTYTPDGKGRTDLSYLPVSGGTVACRIDPLANKSSRPVIEASREMLLSEFVITMPWDAPVGPDDRITLNTHTFEIQSLADEHSWRVSRRAFVNRVNTTG